jgi:hypothetical protein
MSLIIQISTIQGKFIDNCRWEIEQNNLVNVDNTVQVVFKTDDKKIIEVINKCRSQNISIEKDEKEYVMIFSYIVSEVRHMIENDKLESMIIIKPKDRNVEIATLFLKNKEELGDKILNKIQED